jgi:hypothetical protein
MNQEGCSICDWIIFGSGCQVSWYWHHTCHSISFYFRVLWEKRLKFENFFCCQETWLRESRIDTKSTIGLLWVRMKQGVEDGFVRDLLRYLTSLSRVQSNCRIDEMKQIVVFSPILSMIMHEGGIGWYLVAYTSISNGGNLVSKLTYGDLTFHVRKSIFSISCSLVVVILHIGSSFQWELC